MKPTRNDLNFKAAMDLLVGEEMVVDATRARILLEGLKEDGYVVAPGYELKEGVDMTLDDFITLATTLEEFSDTPNDFSDFNDDLESVFKASKAGSGIACLEMFCNTILKDDREYSHFEELITNFNIGGFYLIKGTSYGSIDCKIRLGMAYAMGDFGIINDEYALQIANELEEFIKEGMKSNPGFNLEISECYEDALYAVEMIRGFAGADFSGRFKD